MLAGRAGAHVPALTRQWMTTPFYLSPTFQILFATAAGMAFGWAAPAHAMQLLPLGDLFIDAIRLLAGPFIFCTVCAGIGALGSLRQLGEIGIKGFIYFEVLALLALSSGAAGAWLMQPGAGFQLDPARAAAIAALPAPSFSDTLLSTFTGSMALQLLLAALVCGMALTVAGTRAARLTALVAQAGNLLFKLVRIILLLAPLAAFCAVAYTVGRYGLASVAPLAKLLGAIYLTTVLFVAVVLGAVARACGFSLWRFILFLKEELVLAFGTASSFAAMPGLIDKLCRAGCPGSVAGVLIPAGYSLNLNGSSIYLTLALVFLAQASGVDLDFAQYAAIVAIAMVASKAASGVAGSAFIVLGAMLTVVPAIPPASLLFIFGIERLLKCRPLANIIGNGVACMAVSAWMGQLDSTRVSAALTSAPGLRRA
ncbi:MAG: cation:dicarboxylase symporter family transporter [Pseudomonadota bacterium]